MRNWGAGDERARHCGSVAAVFRRFAHGFAVLLRWFALGLRMALRFCCGGLPSVCAWLCGSVAVVCLGSRLSFFLCQEKRDGLRCLAFLFRRVEIAIRAFSLCLYGYLPLAGSLRVWPFLYGDLDGLPGRGERETGLRRNGAGGVDFARLCAAALALLCFPRGVRWGCAPQTAPKSLRLSGLSSRCGGAALAQIRCAVTRAHG